MTNTLLELAPLRAVMSRNFVASEGTHILLSCGHTLVRSRDRHRQKMRCDECLKALIEGDSDGR